jgi:uncharacterized protein YcbK (DUF882 family)
MHYNSNMEVTILPKGSQSVFSDVLKHKEVECKCQYPDCHYTLVHDRTIRAFHLVRQHFGEPIIVTSGFRCQRHNKEVGGKATSFHTKGSAIDLKPRNGDLDGLEHYARLYFDFVLRYEDMGFIHCHNTEDYI